MRDELATISADSVQATRLDLVVFVAAFLVGLCAYVTLHFVIRAPQGVVTAAVAVVMGAYALVVSLVPRLRVRMDQAGDNAYYLGLLFTLVSMAFALYEYGVAAAGSETEQAPQRGVELIITNFGIALASTILGIFLRVLLHQMRVDPTEVEATTRIELAEASKRVRASIDQVTSELGRFHDEVQQRMIDLLATFVEVATKSSSGVVEQVGRSTKEMLESTATVSKEILEQNRDLARLLGETATEAKIAVERFRAVEPPSVTLSRRLEKLAKGKRPVNPSFA